MNIKNKKILLLVLFISLLTCVRLFRSGYFSMQDDTQIFRLQQFDQCLKDGQIPCRFISSGGLGYGYPIYNYYPPFAYALAETFHLLGFSLINSIKAIFILGHLLAGLGMFLLASAFWGNYGALLSTTLYLFAPYRAVDAYVRGALSEFLALSLLPFIFYFVKKKKTRFFVVFLTLLLLTHNLTSLVILGLLFIYFLFQKQTKKLLLIFYSFLLSAFFLIPAVFEKNLVTLSTMTQDYFDYRAHFVTLKQLFFDRSWGFGASLWGPVDDMSFQIGWPHWLLFIVALLFTIKSKNHQNKILIFISSLVAVFCLFLTHNRSTFIWTNLPFMAYFQFPWRFLGPFVFILSFISGSLLLPFKKPQIILSLLLILIIALNLSYFKEDIWFPSLTDQEKLNSAELIRQSGAGLMDYWPNYSTNFPHQFAPTQPSSLQDITINDFNKNSHQAYLDITVKSPSAEITFPMVYFPNWQVCENNKILLHSLTPDLGLITVNLSQGSHQLNLKLKNTPLRTISNLISLLSLIGFSFYALKTKK